jgi:hypothetical protein
LIPETVLPETTLPKPPKALAAGVAGEATAGETAAEALPKSGILRTLVSVARKHPMGAVLGGLIGLGLLNKMLSSHPSQQAGATDASSAGDQLMRQRIMELMLQRTMQATAMQSKSAQSAFMRRLQKLQDAQGQLTGGVPGEETLGPPDQDVVQTLLRAAALRRGVSPLAFYQ